MEKEVPGFIGRIVSEMEKEGITVAKIYGDNDKGGANDNFQNGSVQVVVGTAKSASTGIDLDDQKGGEPRTLFVVTPNYSGNVFQQVLGRVSRRNTKSPAKVMFIYTESVSDNRRKEIVGGKIKTLEAIQNGQIQDEFDETTIPSEVKTNDGSNTAYVAQYSDKAVAVFGDSRNIKDKLKSAGGRYNGNLSNPTTGKKEPGWIFPNNKKEELAKIIVPTLPQIKNCK